MGVQGIGMCRYIGVHGVWRVICGICVWEIGLCGFGVQGMSMRDGCRENKWGEMGCGLFQSCK